MFVSRSIVLASTALLTVGAAGTSLGLLHSTFAVEPPNVEPSQAARAADAPPKDEDKDDPVEMQRSVNNLKQLGLAMHSFHDSYNQFPPVAVYSKDGKPLLSWRVLVLPYLEQRDLFKQFKLNEPWDSPHNKELLSKMPAVYRAGQANPREPFTTYYQVFAGPGTMFDGTEGCRIAKITDGTSITIMIAEGAEAVPWTKPADLVYDRKKPVPKLGGPFKTSIRAAFADGSVQEFTRKWNEEQEKTMHLLIQCADGKVIDMAARAGLRFQP
jgi:hypothetical protein